MGFFLIYLIFFRSENEKISDELILNISDAFPNVHLDVISAVLTANKRNVEMTMTQLSTIPVENYTER